MLPIGDVMYMGRVTKRDRFLDDNSLETANDNPIPDTPQYIVKFDDGDEAELAANAIA